MFNLFQECIMLRARLLSLWKPLARSLFFLAVGPAFAAGPIFQVIHTFTGSPDGGNPWAQLASDASGNLYGTAVDGGAFGHGYVYELSPPASGGPWTETILYSFQSGTDGSFPSSGLTIDRSGNLFGTTWTGGAQNLGVVFELSPPAQSSAPWTEAVIYTFISSNRQSTGAGGNALLLGRGGLIFGSTVYGGLGNGNIFEMKSQTGGSWLEQTLYKFTGGAGGLQVEYQGSPLVADTNGNLYGTTSNGGAFSSGTVFELSPPLTQNGRWTQTVLYSFGAYPTDGLAPTGGVVLDSSGNLYGAALAGGTGSGSQGVVFKLSAPAIAGQPWTETILHNFVGGSTDGSAPYAGVVLDKSGNIYGVTYTGGPGSCIFNYPGCGTVFEVSSSADGTWTEKLLHTFDGTTDGEFPYGGLTIDRMGRLYGTTTSGGSKNFGTVFRVLP
jgi:uncharacterized repeat protein (TIGR03803 family)